MKQRGTQGRAHLQMLPAPAPSSARLPCLEPLPPRTHQALTDPPRRWGERQQPWRRHRQAEVPLGNRGAYHCPCCVWVPPVSLGP